MKRDEAFRRVCPGNAFEKNEAPFAELLHDKGVHTSCYDLLNRGKKEIRQQLWTDYPESPRAGDSPAPLPQLVPDFLRVCEVMLRDWDEVRATPSSCQLASRRLEDQSMIRFAQAVSYRAMTRAQAGEGDLAIADLLDAWSFLERSCGAGLRDLSCVVKRAYAQEAIAQVFPSVLRLSTPSEEAAQQLETRLTEMAATAATLSEDLEGELFTLEEIQHRCTLRDGQPAGPKAPRSPCCSCKNSSRTTTRPESAARKWTS